MDDIPQDKSVGDINYRDMFRTPIKCSLCKVSGGQHRVDCLAYIHLSK